MIYVPHGLGHAVLNLDENLSITENFLAVSAIDEVAKFHALQWNPMHYDCVDAAKRVWFNLIYRDIKDKDTRRYAKEMLQQIEEHMLKGVTFKRNFMDVMFESE